MRSLIDENKAGSRALQLMDEELALHEVRNYLGIDKEYDCSPIMRHIQPVQENDNPPNVVLVLMESMSVGYMQRFGNTMGITPFLDSLAGEAYFFENIYSAGIHTHNGVFSTLFSFPALYGQHRMNTVSMPKYRGMATSLKEHGYQTVYFTTHDGQFDNIEGFLMANDFDRVVSQSDYPSAKVVNTLGVPDDYMFEFSMPLLQRMHDRQAPFLAVYMTASNHSPFYIPPYYVPAKKEMQQAIVEYSDWALRKLMDMASRQSWFENTLFVFVADHGRLLDGELYEMSLNYSHIPLIMYAPKITHPQTFSGVGGQIDVFPTVMGVLELPYSNNTLGVDLLASPRSCMYFSADDKYGVVNDSLFLVVPNVGNENLYRYKAREKENYIEKYKAIVEQMKLYAKANMQAAQYIINSRKQDCK